eukprot:scaffold5.g738.t1
MRLALEQARGAAAAGEVPVGALLVSAGGELLAAAGNAAERGADPTAHAEVLCIRTAAARAGGWRLPGATLYVTLEPCPMCAGAVLQARVGTLVYGARNPLLGADGSWIAMLPPGHSGAGDSADERGGARSGAADARPCCGGARAPAQAAAEAPAPVAPARPHPFHPGLEVRRGVLEEECGKEMREFFRRRRAEGGQRGGLEGSAAKGGGTAAG